jgi:hypothetical protein
MKVVTALFSFTLLVFGAFTTAAANSADQPGAPFELSEAQLDSITAGEVQLIVMISENTRSPGYPEHGAEAGDALRSGLRA